MMPDAPLAQITPLLIGCGIAVDITHFAVAHGDADAATAGAHVAGRILDFRDLLAVAGRVLLNADGGHGHLLNITKPGDSSVSLDAPLALRERGWGARRGFRGACSALDKRLQHAGWSAHCK